MEVELARLRGNLSRLTEQVHPCKPHQPLSLSHTVSLSHCLTLTLSHSHSLTLSLSHSLSLTLSLSHSLTQTLIRTQTHAFGGISRVSQRSPRKHELIAFGERELLHDWAILVIAKHLRSAFCCAEID